MEESSCEVKANWKWCKQGKQITHSALATWYRVSPFQKASPGGHCLNTIL